MTRPCCCRRVAVMPPCGLFKPAGVPCSSLEEIVLAVDEIEAIRLADLEGMYQEQAAGQMNISRQTFGRIIESARRKVARALCGGMALRIEGGAVEVVGPGPRRERGRCRRRGAGDTINRITANTQEESTEVDRGEPA